MGTFARVMPSGWSQGSDDTDLARVTPTGWEYTSATSIPAVILASGILSYNQQAVSTDFKLVLVSGVLNAKQTLSAGDRVITLVNGVRQGGTPV